MSEATRDGAPDPISPDAGDDARIEGVEDELPRALRQRLEAFIPELVRRTISSSVGKLGTEEAIRKLAKDVPLPKEVAGFLISTAGSTKDEIMRMIAVEVRDFLRTANLGEELARMLTKLSLEVSTEIRFRPSDEGLEPEVTRLEVHGGRRGRSSGRQDEPEETPAAKDRGQD